jgi:hypothetical protein
VFAFIWNEFLDEPAKILLRDITTSTAICGRKKRNPHADSGGFRKRSTGKLNAPEAC